ncbi:Bug family tripartite tricarboxylate transporter substrate binding protein [Bordetella sp. 02P26C-1]|uniref:Bug family tripartite tricarboxylate transporter substrate binding protein n=1 Tax=Bordetella sp. 02P26C-1 TaxID=2683195 RepID=UPI00135526F2|nr:tripartite tricarboxylate transporter substrate binding protein [Bordetella sp. 02P26C-1]MVW77673.1 tripartite tricarboxylate transporter substrate binding protein [Bordetella sp. 02P26C-1]
MKIWKKGVIAIALQLVAASAFAQDFPEGKTLNMVLGFAPGGATDAMARIVAKKVSENTGQSIAVVNKPGAGGNIAQQYVVSAEPDGSTILVGSIGSLTINPHLMTFSYDPLKDLSPITMGVAYPLVLVVNPQVGAKNVKDLVNIAKTKQLDFASSGVGSATHMAGEMLNQRAGINMVHVPYKGGGPAMIDLLGGRIDAYYASPTSAAQHIKNGQLTALATTGPTRAEILPEVPTVAESGYPGYNALNWYAFLAPAKTPKPVIDRWNQEIVKALKSPDVIKLLEEQGLTPMPGTPEELAQFMQTESDNWAKVVKEGKITLQ